MKKYSLQLLSGLAAAACMQLAAAEQMPRPAKLLSGYSSFFLGQNMDELEQDLLRPMKHAKFNSVELKIQQNTQRRMDVAASEKEFADLAERARRNGLFLQIYLYPEPYNAHRKPDWQEHSALAYLVDEKGNAHPDTFSIIDYGVWKETFRHAFDIARLSLKYPIGALKFDIETISNTGLSYDDGAWQRFCQTHTSFDPATPRAERAAKIAAAKAQDIYAAWFAEQLCDVVKKLEAELHAINPKLMLGVMPASHGWVSESFMKHLGTPDAPAIIDDWSMYNGQGFGAQVLVQQKKIKALNPNNLYIPWFRVNSYTTDQLASNAYHAGAKCDGYSNWTMGMVNARLPMSGFYALPGKLTADQYYREYGKANAALAQDIAEGSLDKAARIAYTPVKSLVPTLDYSKLVIPALKPQGNGSMQNSQRVFVMREQQTIFIYAETGEEIQVTLRHMAGDRRPLSLHYTLLNSAKEELRNEAINPGAEETFRVKAPTSGVYALVVSGGLAGQAWYSVEIKNPYFAFDASQQPYFFGTPLCVYLDADAITVTSSERQAYQYGINSGKKYNVVGKLHHKTELPKGLTKLEMDKPNPALDGFYSQDIVMTLAVPQGKLPLIFASPERMLVPAR